MTLNRDVALTYSQARHHGSRNTVRGYCRQITTQTPVGQINGVRHD